MHLFKHWPYQLQTLQVHRSHNVEGNALCDLGLGSRSNQIFLVAFPSKPLDIATLQVHRSYDVEDTGQRFVCVLDLRPRSKVK